MKIIKVITHKSKNGFVRISIKASCFATKVEYKNHLSQGILSILFIYFLFSSKDDKDNLVTF